MKSALERLRELRQNMPAEPVGTTQETLAEFEGSGRVVVIYSDVLECEVVLAADNARVSEIEARPVYRARELMGLTEWTPDGLRLLHEVKTQFGGEVV